MTSGRPGTRASPLLSGRGPENAALVVLVAVGVGVRLAHWWALRGAPFVGLPIMDAAAYLDGARAIAGGDWLARGSFFLAPLYPYLIAVALSLGGSIDAVYLAQIAGAAVAMIALQRAGARLGRPRVGLVAAGLAAFCGPLVFHDVLLLKESFATSVGAVLLVVLLPNERPARRALSRWLVAGVLWGLVALLRENALLLLPFLGCALWLERPRARAFGAGMAALVAGFALATSPFVLRSLVVTGSPFPSYNAGFNLYIGNNPAATGAYRPMVPGKTMVEAEGQEPIRLASRRLGRALTPTEASRYWMAQSLGWITRNPWPALRLQFRKLAMFWEPWERPDSVDYYWMRERSPALRLAFVEVGGLTLLAVLALWPLRLELRRWAPILLWVLGWTLATIPFFVFARFRLPVLPALCLLAAVPVDRTLTALGDGRRTAAIGGLLLVAACLVGPHLLAPEPDRSLVAFNLGGLHSARGDLVAAETSYREALAAANTPELTVLLRLGDVTLDQGRVAEGAAWYRRAVEVAPRSGEAWARYGRAEAFLGRRKEATRALDRALELEPENVVALHGRAHLALVALDVEEATRLRDRIARIEPDHPAVDLLDRQIAVARRRQAEAGSDPE